MHPHPSNVDMLCTEYKHVIRHGDRIKAVKAQL